MSCFFMGPNFHAIIFCAAVGLRSCAFAFASSMSPTDGAFTRTTNNEAVPTTSGRVFADPVELVDEGGECSALNF